MYLSLNMYPHLLLLLVFSWLLLLAQPTLGKNITANIANVTTTSFLGTKPGCQPKCGNLSIPYPFGIGAACSFDSNFTINCSTNSKPFLGIFEVLSILPTQVRIQNVVASMCYNQAGAVTNNSGTSIWSQQLASPYTYSDTENKFTVIGCDDFGELWGAGQAEFLISACGSSCYNSTDWIDANCTGVGCCQTDIPKGLQTYEVVLSSFSNHTQVWSFDKCGYAFMGEQDSFHYSSLSDISDLTFVDRVPIVLDFAIGNQNCVEAQNSNAYLCQPNTSCTNSTNGGSGGYLCTCETGYEGNPYLSPGCTGFFVG